MLLKTLKGKNPALGAMAPVLCHRPLAQPRPRRQNLARGASRGMPGHPLIPTLARLRELGDREAVGEGSSGGMRVYNQVFRGFTQKPYSFEKRTLRATLLIMLSRRTILTAGLGTILKTRGSTMFADARAYERFMGRWSGLAAPLFVEFAGIPDQGEVLDIGSGTGSLALTIARLRPHCRVEGIDLSREYIEFARARTRNPRVRFETGDAQNLPFATGTFDAAASLLVFNFIPDPAKALSEARRVTRVGGSISAAVWDYGDGMRMLRIFWDAAVALDSSAGRFDEKRMPLCRKGELSELWARGGLRKVEESPLEITMRFKNFDDFWNPFLLGQGPAGAYVNRLPGNRVLILREEVRRRLGGPRGPFTLGARLWAVRGEVTGC
jgi:SAM-dependent methyltransferase